jgi:hypothetical protein
MEGKSSDEVDVIDSSRCSKVENLLDDAATDVGGLHLRQRQRDVIEGDGEFHTRGQQGGKGLAVAERIQEGVVDGAVDVLDRFDGFVGIDDPATDRQFLESESLTMMKEDRWCGAVDFEDKASS